jgi:hypothetical protein
MVLRMGMLLSVALWTSVCLMKHWVTIAARMCIYWVWTHLTRPASPWLLRPHVLDELRHVHEGALALVQQLADCAIEVHISGELGFELVRQQQLDVLPVPLVLWHDFHGLENVEIAHDVLLWAAGQHKSDARGQVCQLVSQ